MKKFSLLIIFHIHDLYIRTKENRSDCRRFGVKSHLMFHREAFPSTSDQISFRCNTLFLLPLDCVIGKICNYKLGIVIKIVASSTSKTEIDVGWGFINLIIIGKYMHCFSGIFNKADL